MKSHLTDDDRLAIAATVAGAVIVGSTLGSLVSVAFTISGAIVFGIAGGALSVWHALGKVKAD